MTEETKEKISVEWPVTDGYFGDKIVGKIVLEGTHEEFDATNMAIVPFLLHEKDLGWDVPSFALINREDVDTRSWEEISGA